MDLLFAFLTTLAILIAINVAARAVRSRRRNRSANLPAGETIEKRLDGVSARIFADRTVPQGPKSGGISRDPATLILGQRRFLVCTGHGRILEIGPDRPGVARCVGPRRLAIEGQHPSGRAKLRVELILDDAEGWATSIAALSAG
jgi:hypothetical protein